MPLGELMCLLFCVVLCYFPSVKDLTRANYQIKESCVGEISVSHEDEYEDYLLGYCTVSSVS